MKVGDFVAGYRQMPGPSVERIQGLVVGFNKRGQGGKDYVHVLSEGKVHIYMRHNLEVISEGR